MWTLLLIITCPIWIPIALILLLLAVMCMMCFWFLIMWMCGAPIQIKENNKIIGVVRWFKFRGR